MAQHALSTSGQTVAVSTGNGIRNGSSQLLTAIRTVAKTAQSTATQVCGLGSLGQPQR